jgi:hypothetical protein
MKSQNKTSDTLDQYRAEKAKLAELERLERKVATQTDMKKLKLDVVIGLSHVAKLLTDLTNDERNELLNSLSVRSVLFEFEPKH